MKIGNWKLKIFTKSSGQSLIEILIGIALAVILIGGAATAAVLSLRSSQSSRQLTYAENLIADMSSGVKNLASQNWHTFWGPSSLVDFWDFDENSGSTVYDYVGGNSGTANGTTVVAGKTSNARSFNGTSDYIDFGNLSALNFATTSFSVSVWFKDNGGLNGMMLSNALGLGNAGITIISGYNSTAGNYSCRIADGSNEQDGAVITGLNDSNWHNLICVVDRSSQLLEEYIDGTATTTTGISLIGSVNSTSSFQIAARNGASFYKGTIDDVRIYNHALSAPAISNLYTYPGEYYPVNTNGTWSITEGEATSSFNNITFYKSFTINPVQRDSNNNIVSSGGTLDPTTKQITYTVKWNNKQSQDQSREYISQTGSNGLFLQTTWSAGTSSSIFFQGMNAYSNATSITASSSIQLGGQ